MDSLTQIVLGGAVGELVAGKNLGNRAILWGAIAGTIPDLDVFVRVFYHPIEAALVHRGFSHSILFAVLFGPLLGWILDRVTRKKYGLPLWIKLFFWGIITHPMLDMFTNYGTQFFWPLDYRITFNSVFVIDPLYTLPFMFLLIWAMRLHKKSNKRRQLNKIGLIYSTSYLALGLLIKWFVWRDAETYFKSKEIILERMMVTPMPFTNLYWYVLGEGKSKYHLTNRSLLNSKIDPHKTIERGPIRIDSLKWNGKSHNQDLLQSTDGYYLLETKGNKTICYDLRFGFLSKLTNEKLNTPLMGYAFKWKDGKIIDTQTHRLVKWTDLDFGYYWLKVFGKP